MRVRCTAAGEVCVKGCWYSWEVGDIEDGEIWPAGMGKFCDRNGVKDIQCL